MKEDQGDDGWNGRERNPGKRWRQVRMAGLKLRPNYWGTRHSAWEKGRDPNPAATSFNTGRTWSISVQFSRSVVSDSSWPHEPQHARSPCPSPTSHQKEMGHDYREAGFSCLVTSAFKQAGTDPRTPVPACIVLQLEGYTDSHRPTCQFGILSKDWTLACLCDVLGS